jgi:hypothetical protein
MCDLTHLMYHNTTRLFLLSEVEPESDTTVWSRVGSLTRLDQHIGLRVTTQMTFDTIYSFNTLQDIKFMSRLTYIA